MITEDLEVSLSRFYREINYTHKIWDDEIWNFLYREHISEIEKLSSELLNELIKAEKYLTDKQKQINSI